MDLKAAARELLDKTASPTSAVDPVICTSRRAIVV
jgi:hypothetical protein